MHSRNTIIFDGADSTSAGFHAQEGDERDDSLLGMARGPSGGWLLLDSAGPWFASLCATESGIEAAATNLVDFCTAKLSRAQLSSMFEAFGSADDGQMLDLMARYWDGDGPADLSVFCVHQQRVGGMARVEWQLRTITCATFDCLPVAAPAERLRDTLLLPLLRTTEELRRRIPEGPSAIPPNAPMPLPTLGQPLLRALLKLQPDSSGDCTAGADHGESGAAAGARGGASGRPSAADNVAQPNPSDAASSAPSAPPPLVGGATEASRNAPNQAAERRPSVDEERRKRVAEARERAANKAGKKA